MAVSLNLFLLQLFNGLALGLLYVLVASGLTLIFGVTDILNFAHGALYMLGAYIAVLIFQFTGSFYISLLVAPVAVGIVGAAIERSTLHYIYDRDVTYQILLTFGITLMITDIVRFVFPNPVPIDTPALLSGPTNLGFIIYPTYQLFVIGMAIVVIFLLLALFKYSDFGLILRAGAQNKGAVRLQGINISRYFTLVFGIGSVLAGLAGVLAAPFITVTGSMGNNIIIVAFIVVILGGLGSFKGSIVAGLLIGVTETLGQTFFPDLSGYYIYLLLLVGLLIRPQGLFGSYDVRTELAKIKYDRIIEPIPLRDRRALASIGLLIVAPLILVAVDSTFLIRIGTLMLVWGLLALSLDLVLGYLGLLSFGHAAFIGLGAYTTGLSLIHISPSFPLALLITVVITTVVAWLVGALSIRFHGVYFAITTLAVAQIFYQLSINLTDLTGGTNGLVGIPTPEIMNVDIGETVPFYFITLLIVVIIYAGLIHVLNSPFGRVMVALRESERRTAFLGYNTNAVKRRAFALSGLVAGVAGVLFAGLQGFITPSILFWTSSGDALFAVTLGGMGTLFGPILGGMSFVGLEQVLSSYLDAWRFIVGLLLVVVVMFAPRGLVSIRSVVDDMLRNRGGQVEESEDEPGVPDTETPNPSGGKEK